MFPSKILVLCCLATLFQLGCQNKTTDNEMSDVPSTPPDQDQTASSITSAFFGTTASGDSVDLYTLTDDQVTIKIMTYGAIVTSIIAPDKDGNKADIVLGFDSLDPYLQQHPYFGATVGRYGNRIANGTFSLDGSTYTLATNNGPNHLHGGLKGFDKVVWQAELINDQGQEKLQMSYLSIDGEEGYPGNLSVKVQFYLATDGALYIDYFATTDKTTPINLTNHSYFNLNGGSDDILDHEVYIKASRYTPVDEGLIPLGQLAEVAGTPFDFLAQPMPIGARIKEVPGGYDHNYVLNDWDSKLNTVARVSEPTTGRTLEVLTTEPGMQFYTGNFLTGIPGKGGTAYEQHYGFCMETQHFPDSPNQPDFPSCWLSPGEEYRQTTVYRFGVKDQE